MKPALDNLYVQETLPGVGDGKELNKLKTGVENLIGLPVKLKCK